MSRSFPSLTEKVPGCMRGVTIFSWVEGAGMNPHGVLWICSFSGLPPGQVITDVQLVLILAFGQDLLLKTMGQVASGSSSVLAESEPTSQPCALGHWIWL